MDEKIGGSQLGTKERKSRGKGQNVLSRGRGCWKKELNTLSLIELSSDLLGGQRGMRRLREEEVICLRV